MDTRNARSRKAIETFSQAINEPTLKDLLRSINYSPAQTTALNQLIKRIP